MFRETWAGSCHNISLYVFSILQVPIVVGDNEIQPLVAVENMAFELRSLVLLSLLFAYLRLIEAT